MVEATNNVIECTNTAYAISYSDWGNISQSQRVVWTVADGQLTQNWEALKMHNDLNADIHHAKTVRDAVSW